MPTPTIAAVPPQPLRRPALPLLLLSAIALLLGALPPGQSAAASAVPQPAAAAQDKPVQRLSGPDRVATSAALSRHGWTTNTTAVLVRSDAFADALAAGMLADHLGAPLLLTARDGLSPAAEAELKRLGVRRAVIVGGTSAVGSPVAQRLGQLGARVERVAGPDRFATAVAVSKALGANGGADGVLLARGAHADPFRAWPDALAGGAFAALDGPPRPLLLTADALPAVTRQRVAELGAPVTILGGADTVPAAQATALTGVVPSVHRLAGPDRFATSMAVADAVLAELDGDPRPLVIASGMNYPDALAAAALVGRVEGVLLLVPPAGVDPSGPIGTWLTARQQRFSSLLVVGGANVLGDRTVSQVAAAAGMRPPEATHLAFPRFGSMSPQWRHVFTIPYGPGEAQLGTSLGGDEQQFAVGADSGVQHPDGTWSILDVGKLRIARYDKAGRYLGQVVLPPELLPFGSMPYQLPRVLDDGTLVAFAMRMDGTATDVLRVRGGRADVVVLPGPVTAFADDGKRLYGLDDDGRTVQIDLDRRAVTRVDAYRGRDGRPYSVTTGGGQLRYTRPEARQDRTIPVVAAQAPGGPLGFGAQVASGEDGTLHLLVVGVPLADTQQAVGGYTSIRPDGSFTPVEQVRNPWSRFTEFSSPAHLGVRPGTDEVTLWFSEPDGFHVYRRR